MTSSNYLLALYNRCLRLPAGKRIFSALFARKAPYFRSIRPLITQLEPGFCELQIKKRKAVQNHIGTVHAIALCNGLEMAMGAVAEATIAKHLRWIPKGMQVNYTAKADSDIRITAEAPTSEWTPGDLDVVVNGYTEQGTLVITGTITIYVSEKPARSV
ncbi:hotdog fold domain-containing protein [Aliidiomarina sp. Khilg15.8]